MENPNEIYPWWDECRECVERWLKIDPTTKPDNLYKKAKNYANNYIVARVSGNKPDDMEKVITELAMEIIDKLNRIEDEKVK